MSRILLYSTGKCSQYLIINHNGKECEKEYTHTRVYVHKGLHVPCVFQFSVSSFYSLSTVGNFWQDPKCNPMLFYILKLKYP